MTKPKLAKAYSALMAEKYIHLGWTLKHQFYEDDDDEPCEYLFEWLAPGEPISPADLAANRKLN